MSEINNRIGRLYYCLSDDDKVKIDNLYVTYKDYLKTVIVKDQCPWFVNHGLSHINGVLNNMKYIIERFNRTTDYTNHLIKDELYFLLCAVIYHDIGMGYTPKNIKDINDACDTVREKHGEYSGKLLEESETIGTHFKDHDIVATIMKYHQAKAPLNKRYESLIRKEGIIPLYIPIKETMKHDGVELRTELLAALLQLADACDISKERVNDLENRFREKYNEWYAGIKITTLINDFTKNVDKSEEDKLLILEQKLNDDLYLFSWNEIPGNDDERIIEFLKDEFKIEWAKTENISKIDDGKTIIVSDKEKSLSLKLNDKKTKVNLKIDDGRVDEFTVKTENGKLNIYDDFTKNVDESEEDKLLILEQKLNDENLTEAIEVINRCKNLDCEGRKAFEKQIKHVKMVLGQKSHIEKHKSIEDISFNDEHIIIKLSHNYNKNHIDDILKVIMEEIKLEAVLTDTTFSRYLPTGKKLFKYICVYDENNNKFYDEVPIFPENKYGKLENKLKIKSETEGTPAWSKFNELKEAYLTNRRNCDLCENGNCISNYSKHCIYIEQRIDEITCTYGIYLKTDDLFAILWAIWGHELCNPMIFQNSNFNDYESKLEIFKNICSYDEKQLFDRGSKILFAHTDYIFNNKLKTKYKNFELETVNTTFYESDVSEYDLNMPQLFWLLRYCELIGKAKSYCILDYPHWSLIALQRCWPIDFKQKIHYPEKIATIISSQYQMNGNNLEGEAINEFLFVVIWYELNNMYELATNDWSEKNLGLQNYEFKKFECSKTIQHDMYLQMCKDFASENKNQLEKISNYYDVRVDEFIVETENGEIKKCYEFDEEKIKDTLLEMNGDYLCDIFMKSYKAYLFSWDKILEKDYEIFIKFLNQHFDNEWVKTAEIKQIKQINGGTAINVFSETKFISLSLNDDKTKAYLKIDDDKPYEFIAKTENHKLNIYRKNFLHSYKCGYTGLKLNNETSSSSNIIKYIIDKLFVKYNQNNLYKALYLYLSVYCNNFNYDIKWVQKQIESKNRLNNILT